MVSKEECLNTPCRRQCRITERETYPNYKLPFWTHKSPFVHHEPYLHVVCQCREAVRAHRPREEPLLSPWSFCCCSWLLRCCFGFGGGQLEIQGTRNFIKYGTRLRSRLCSQLTSHLTPSHSLHVYDMVPLARRSFQLATLERKKGKQVGNSGTPILKFCHYYIPLFLPSDVHH